MSLPSLTAASFYEAVSPPTRTLVVAFLADWCSPCRMLRFALAAIADELPSDVELAEVDADAENELTARFHVEVLPTMVAFRAGRPIRRLTGTRPKAQLLAELSGLTATDPQE